MPLLYKADLLVMFREIIAFFWWVIPKTVIQLVGKIQTFNV